MIFLVTISVRNIEIIIKKISGEKHPGTLLLNQPANAPQEKQKNNGRMRYLPCLFFKRLPFCFNLCFCSVYEFLLSLFLTKKKSTKAVCRFFYNFGKNVGVRDAVVYYFNVFPTFNCYYYMIIICEAAKCMNYIFLTV